MDYTPQYADVGNTHGIDAVRFFQRFPGESPSLAGHTFGISRPGTVMEALSTVREKPWLEYDTPCIIHRCNKFTPSELKAVADFARDKFLGDAYGVLKIPTQLADWILAWGAYYAYGRTGELRLARKLQFLRYSLPNCHLVWAISFEDVLGYRFGCPALETNPDQILDHQQASDDWDCVYQSPGWAAV